MTTLDFTKRPCLEIVFPDGSVHVLQKKLIAVRDSERYDARVMELNEKLSSGTIGSVEYSHLLLAEMCDGYDREAFDQLDVHDLIEVARTLGNLKRPATEKKSG